MKRLQCVQFVMCGALFFGCAQSSLYAQNQAPEPPSAAATVAKKQTVNFTKQGVAAANPLAAEAGYAMLKLGGSAVDAAIATQLVLGLVEPQSSGIGGGAFALVHSAASSARGPRAKKSPQQLFAYDARETAPAAATPERFIDAGGLPLKFYDAVINGKSIGIPGTVALLESMHKRHGKLLWRELFKPAIALAETGFPVSPRLNTVIKVDRFLKDDPASRAYFFDASGEPWPIGHALKNQDYATVLKAIAQNGAKGFYEGDIAQSIVDASRDYKDTSKQGDLAIADFANYRVIERTPVCSNYRGFNVCGFPAPSSGGVAIAQMLAALERHPLSQWGPNSVDSVHAISEAGRLAFADRGRYVADPAFTDVPTGLIDGTYMKSRGDLIDLQKSMKRAEPGTPPGTKTVQAADNTANLTGTSHISVIDQWGNAVSMTTTIEDVFGARKMVRGFMLNNELTDFSMAPSEQGVAIANRVQSGKRPRSSMAPTIAYDATGRVNIIAGSPGGSAIINYVAKTLVGLIDWKLDPQTIIDMPNFGSRNGPTELEKGTELESLRAALQARGHSVNMMEFTSGIQALQRTYNAKGKATGWRGGADSRREGMVLGD
jgi:gamma-glutamyltranspeptidase / glutathione hydrolase